MKEQEQRWIYFWLFRVALMLCVLIAAACGLYEWWTSTMPALLPMPVVHILQCLGSGIIIGATPSEGQEMNCMKDKQNKIVRDKVRTNNVSQAAHIVKIAEKQKNPEDFLQPGARKISVRP